MTFVVGKRAVIRKSIASFFELRVIAVEDDVWHRRFALSAKNTKIGLMTIKLMDIGLVSNL